MPGLSDNLDCSLRLKLCVLPMLHLPCLLSAPSLVEVLVQRQFFSEPSRNRFPSLYSKVICTKNSFTQNIIHSSLVSPRDASCLIEEAHIKQGQTSLLA